MDDPGFRVLNAGDLVEDREVSEVESDRLSHAQIATQLAELVRTIPAPSNVALYGPWGSGKSGIGNLLREEVAAHKGIRFARFDAFKYAETPLRRSFVSAVATELGIKDETFHAGLYSGHTRTDVKIPANKILKILGIFAALALALSGILVGVVAIIAALQSGPYRADFSSLCRTAVAAGLVPAALLSALITLANRTLQVDRSSGKPDSDEQFEHIFKELVSRAKADRIVIFVDELDRCAAAEVVATLDAIRTFLGVSHCVFVIAADQGVLEESLTRAARQETPTDEVNPYYSTGSAYLDKVFQYQISLPPLMSQRITRFAADLVKDRGGLWSEINSDYVISVLVPPHVVSPRRVKHLLNTFALTYRLAQDRHSRGLLAEDARANAATIAKLVCLRVEFPLFARDLEIDSRLPEMALRIMDNEKTEFGGTYPPQAVQRAKEYATNNAAPAGLLANGQVEADSDGAAQVEAQSNRQLLEYLRRTKTVPGPSRDFVFMHSTGTAFGLDGQTALAIEAAAENADSESVARLLGGADPATQDGVLQLLNDLIRTSLGVGGPNAARTLLSIYQADQTLPVARIADSASEMIAVLQETHADLLDDETIGAAWQLAGQGSEAGTLQLRDSILSKADASHDMDVSFLLQNPSPALASKHEFFGQLIARELVREEGAESVTLLANLDDAIAQDVVRASSSAVSAALQTALDEHQATAEATNTAPAQPPSPVAGLAASAPVEPEEAFDPAPILNALSEYAKERAVDSPSLGHQVTLTLLGVDRRQGRDTVESLLPELEPVADAEIVAAVLVATGKRILRSWPIWLAGIAPSAVATEHATAISNLATTLWAYALKEDVELTAVQAAVAALMGVIDQLPPEMQPNLTTSAEQAVAEAVTDDTAAAQRSRRFRNLEPFSAAGLVDPGQVYRAALPALHETFAATIGGEISADGSLGQYLSRDVVDIVRFGTPDNENGPEQVKSALAQLTDCAWLPDPLRTESLLKLMGASGLPLADLGTLPNVNDIVALVQEYGSAAAATVEEWVSLARPDAGSIAAVLVALREKRVSARPIVSAVVNVRHEWSQGERLEFIRDQIADPTGRVPDGDEAQLIGLRDVDASDDVAKIIIERYERSTNNSQRKAVVGVIAAAGITESTGRKRLIESIVISLLNPPNGSPQIGTTEIALDALAHIGPPLPFGVKGVLSNALKTALLGNDALEKKAIKTLEPLGFSIESSGWLFSRKKSIKYSE